MTLIADHCFLCVRDFDSSNGPVLPAGWTLRTEHNGWYSLQRTSDGERMLAWRANTNAAGTRALYALFAKLSILQAIQGIEPLCFPATATWTLAVGGNATAIAVMRRWPIYVMTGSIRLPTGAPTAGTTALVAVTNQATRLFPEGGALPALPISFPVRYDASGAQVGTDGAAAVRVDSISQPAMSFTLAGFPFDTTLTSET
jgi:hypothetical protein